MGRAEDRLVLGKSTFFVELEETLNIIQNSSRSSLVVLDELGRGTSSKDGFSIAASVCRYFLEKIKCVNFFATHFTNLSKYFEGESGVRFMRMGYKLTAEGLLLTHKVQEGLSERSFAAEVANKAGLIFDKDQ